MSTQVVELPGGVTLSGFYYPEIVRELFMFLRANKDKLGLTDENENEVHVKLLQAFALVGHLNNTRLDALATEMFIDSAQLLESLKQMFRLIGVELKSATPAVVDLLIKLSGPTSSDVLNFIPALSDFETDATPPVVYESPEDPIDLDRTDHVKYVYGLMPLETDTNGEVVAGQDTIERTAGVWVVDIVGDEIWIGTSSYDNQGAYRVVERVSASIIRVVSAKDSSAPGFTTESMITWQRRRYTTDLSAFANGPGGFAPLPPGMLTLLDSAFYVAHDQVQPAAVGMTFIAPADQIQGVWEYFDDQMSKFYPTALVVGAGFITFTLDSLLGTKRADMALVTAEHIKTGAKERGLCTWNGVNNVFVTTGLLGQVVASTDEEDYLITAEWIPFEIISDGMIVGGEDLEQDGVAKWYIPQTIDRRWDQTLVNNKESNWFRFRVVYVGGVPFEPMVDDLTIHDDAQYLLVAATQGTTIGPQVIGSSTGTANQEFELPNVPYLDDSETIEVDESGAGVWVEYTYVKTFRDSTSASRHYMRQVSSKDVATLTFGDGTKGKVPPLGAANIRATYRIGGDQYGNVGPDTVVINANGIPGLASVGNPRPANGWRIKDGGDAEDIKRIKRDIPAELRVRDTASNPTDVERLAVESFIDDDGLKPVARAFAVEEGYGVKTIKLLVVGLGGALLSGAQLEALDLWFNGDRYAVPPVQGKLLMNHELTAINYEPAIIEIDTTVLWKRGNAASVRDALLAYLNPLVVEADEVTYTWNFAGQVSKSKLYSLIHAIDPNILDVRSLVVRINGVVGTTLGANELPVTNSSLLNVTIVEV